MTSSMTTARVLMGTVVGSLVSVALLSGYKHVALNNSVDSEVVAAFQVGTCSFVEMKSRKGDYYMISSCITEAPVDLTGRRSVNAKLVECGTDRCKVLMEQGQEKKFTVKSSRPMI